jgi:hypothetical protein
MLGQVVDLRVGQRRVLRRGDGGVPVLARIDVLAAQVFINGLSGHISNAGQFADVAFASPPSCGQQIGPLLGHPVTLASPRT